MRKRYTTIGFLKNGKRRQDSTDNLKLATDRMKNYSKAYIITNTTGRKLFKKGF